jgi:mannitol-1-/sugar-/sorbitol-6-phosphatase
MSIAHGRRTIETMRLIVPHIDADMESVIYERNECNDLEGIKPIAGAVEFTHSFDPNRWAIVTSCGYKLALSRLKHAGITPPKVLITADDVLHGKPAPEGYAKAAHVLGHAPVDCVVFEDAPNGVAAACNAGMRCVGLCTTHDAKQMASVDFVIQDLCNVSVALESDCIRLELVEQKAYNLSTTCTHFTKCSIPNCTRAH